MANQKASLLDLVTKHHMTVVGASLRSMDQARQSNPVFLDIFSRMDRHKTSANRQQQKLKLVDDVLVEVTGLTTRIDLSEGEDVCYLVMGSWTFSLVILSNVSVLACDDINFFCCCSWGMEMAIFGNCGSGGISDGTCCPATLCCCHLQCFQKIHDIQVTSVINSHSCQVLHWYCTCQASRSC